MIPYQFQGYPLIRVCRPDCASHDSCNSPGKRPVYSVEDNKPVKTILKWTDNGGNYGIVARRNNDLVIFDSDSDEFSNLLDEYLPQTLIITSGSGGEHRYYQCNNCSLNRDWKGETKGSIRTENWQAVGPGSTHPNGNTYKITENRPIASVSIREIRDCLGNIGNETAVKTAAAAAKPSSRRDNPRKPTEGTLADLQQIYHDERRKEVAEVIDATRPSRDRRVWVTGFLSYAGFSKQEIQTLFLDHATWATDPDRVTIDVESVVDTSKRTGTAYKSQDERRKTESLGLNEGTQRGENTMPEYNDTEVHQVQNGSPEEGDSCYKLVRVEITDDDGSTGEFVSIRKGNVQQITTFDGDSQMAPVYPDDARYNGTSLSTNSLKAVGEALIEFADEIEN